MNKDNNNSIKRTFSNIHPSDECIERVFDMTKEKDKHATGVFIRKTVSVALAFAILIGGGFGINSLSKRNNDNFVSQSGYSIGGIMTVEAKEPLKIGDVNADAGYDMGYRIYTKSIEGLTDEEIENEKISMAKLWLCSGDTQLSEKEKFDEFTLSDTLKNNIHQNANVIYATERGVEEQSITLCGIDDPSTVKEIIITNKNNFGYPIIEANDLYYSEDKNGAFVYDNVGVDTSKTNIKGHNISLSGDRYMQCRIIENPEAVTYGKESFDKDSTCFGKELATGKVFYIIYEFSDEFYNMLGSNPDYNLTDYEDEINVTVEFKDGKKAENILKITMDEYGKVYCGCKSYSIK